ncbi:MAG TPA: beta-galactosidase, partial [Anaerolineaceae bacterium]|nr:beta-galactosidase [Anaerolineaceae bacterium]
MPPLTLKPSIFLGATYYAEQFSPDQWTDDIALMQKAGLTAVRLGDTAWSAFQPDEDIFTLDWMAGLLDRFEEAGIAVIMATPAAAPPVWLTSKYPDMLALQENGRRMLSENRSPVCITSLEHHAAANKIVKAMLASFGKHPAIIGWQADNAFQRVCYCERCQAQFQEFLKDKYGSLADLNQRWSSRVRSQEYTAWEQINLPAGSHHPVLLLEHKRFVTGCYEKYLGMLVHLLREGISEGAWITHNFQGMDSPHNSTLLAGQLDTAGMDWYIGRGQHDFR